MLNVIHCFLRFHRIYNSNPALSKAAKPALVTCSTMATQMQIPDKLKQDGATSHIIIECTNDDQTKPKAGGQDVGGSNGKIWCIFGALLILVSATSVIALAVSLVALRSSETMSEFKEMDYTQSDGDSDKSVLFQVKYAVLWT